MNWKPKQWSALLVAVLAVLTLPACEHKQQQQMAPAVQKRPTPLIIRHALGSTRIDVVPQRVAALDMNEVDFLDQLQVPVAGMPKDFIPHFLAKYQNKEDIADLGAIVQPNMERIHALKPDLILMTPLQTDLYAPLTQIAPTLHYDINYRDSQQGHIATIKNHFLTLGQIFDREKLAQAKVNEIDVVVQKVRAVTMSRPEKALVVLYNNGSFNQFGVQSRYGFIFSDLGVKPANKDTDTNLHGQPISSEFIKKADPDILYIIDRTAVMEHRPVVNADQVGNPLLRATKAWKNGRVIFVDPDAWYTTAASPTSLNIMMAEVLKAYH